MIPKETNDNIGMIPDAILLEDAYSSTGLSGLDAFFPCMSDLWQGALAAQIRNGQPIGVNFTTIGGLSM